jgi:hypothetical protein
VPPGCGEDCQNLGHAEFAGSALRLSCCGHLR